MAGIQTGSVFYFEDEQLYSSQPHYYVVLNKSPRTDEFLILVCASSQVAKRKRIAQKLGFRAGTLVFISPSEYPLFTRETVIDCNRAFEKTPQALAEKLDRGTLKVCTELMSPDIVQKLVSGLASSTQVSEKIKRAVRS